MRWRRTILTLLLTACVSATALTTASAQQDFAPVDSGSVVVGPEGDTLRVGRDSWLVSGTALARMDSAERALRADLEDCRTAKAKRAEQVYELIGVNDSLRSLVRAQAHWREDTEELLGDLRGNSGLIETLENFGLAAGGFAVCRMTED